MKETKSTEQSNPWYKEPWPWILMAGPFLAVVGCLVTIYLAYTDNYDQEVRLDAHVQGKYVSRDGKDILNVFGVQPTAKTPEESK